MPRTRGRRETGAMGGQKGAAIRHFLDTAGGASAEWGCRPAGAGAHAHTRHDAGNLSVGRDQAEVEQLSGVAEPSSPASVSPSRVTEQRR